MVGVCVRSGVLLGVIVGEGKIYPRDDESRHTHRFVLVVPNVRLHMAAIVTMYTRSI